LGAPKTKDLVSTLRALGLEGVTTVVATADYEKNVYLSARNVPGLGVTRVADLNALAVLRPKRMLVTKAALELIQSKNGTSAA
jgi:large subunit ribosomal protein L4